MRWLRRGTILLVSFLAIVAVGRLTMMWMDSFYQGTRAPYLQMLANDAVTIRWQSEQPYIGDVAYGVSADLLKQHARESTARTEHEVRISGLQSQQRYYYSLGDGKTAEYSGADYWFVTAAKAGVAVPVRFWVLGDPGYASDTQRKVRDSMLGWMQKHPRGQRPLLDFVMTTGDNAYTSGTNLQFQQGFFTPYANWLRNYAVWPIYGNHDARRWVFFDVFSLPTRAESGGVASGTEHYYSFDYGPLHVVVLDTQASDMKPDSAMLTWLARDLANNKQPWLVSVFHHPPYSKGTHNSDRERDSHGRMFAVRENILPMLEKAGVDLVLSGHSHMYERSALLDCHYSDSSSLQNDMIRERNPQSIYHKQSPGLAPHQGTIYAVVGSSAKLDQGALDHPAMPHSIRESGSLVVDIAGNHLVAHFINPQGVVKDRFEIIKGVPDGVSSSRCGQ